MGHEYLDVPFEIKEVDNQTGIFKGYASTFGGKPDSYGDVIVRGAFKDTLEKGGRNGFGIAMLWQHENHSPIGTWLEISEDEKGLPVVGKLTKGVTQAEEAILLLKDKALRGLSIGYNVDRDGYEYDDKKKIRYLKKIELWEISLVTFPANIRARITTVKAIEQAKTERELEKALRDAGLSQKESLIVVNRCKPYLREIREHKTWNDTLSYVKELSLQSEVYRISTFLN